MTTKEKARKLLNEYKELIEKGKWIDSNLSCAAEISSAYLEAIQRLECYLEVDKGKV